MLVAVLISFLAIGCDTVSEIADGDTDVDGDSDGDTDVTAYLCDESEGVCTDSQGIMWEWIEMTPNEIDVYDLASAISYCDDLTLGGFGDWRLPTFEELRSLVRGCPDSETGGACGVSDTCVEPESCGGGSCSYCAGGLGPEWDTDEEVDCPSEECPNEGCKLCAAFYEGPCIGCAFNEGPGIDGCYWSSELEWTCMSYWSSTTPPALAKHAWGIDFYLGQPIVAGDYYEGTSGWGMGLGVRCVRTM